MKHSVWRLINDPKEEPAYNMALDETLLANWTNDQEEAAVLRFYGWNRPTITLGYTQNIELAIHPGFCHEHGIPVIRRITGGGAVFHNDELTYAVIAPWQSSAFPFRSMRSAYCRIAQAFEHGFAQAGLRVASRASSDRQRLEGACFASIAPHELTFHGKKLVGSAQRRLRDGFIQHGSIPFTLDRVFVSHAFGYSHYDNIFHNMITLSEIAPSLTSEDLRKGLQLGFAEIFGARFRHRPVTSGERKAAEALAQRKYQTGAWLRRRARSQPTAEIDAPARS